MQGKQTVAAKRMLKAMYAGDKFLSKVKRVAACDDKDAAGKMLVGIITAFCAVLKTPACWPVALPKLSEAALFAAVAVRESQQAENPKRDPPRSSPGEP